MGARSFSNFLFLPLFLFFLFFFSSSAEGVEKFDEVLVLTGVVHCSVAMTFPLLCFRRREHSLSSFTILSQHETMEGSTWARVTSVESLPAIVTSDGQLSLSEELTGGFN